jgi:hypothetical protein
MDEKQRKAYEKKLESLAGQALRLSLVLRALAVFDILAWLAMIVGVAIFGWIFLYFAEQDRAIAALASLILTPLPIWARHLYDKLSGDLGHKVNIRVGAVCAEFAKLERARHDLQG